MDFMGEKKSATGAYCFNCLSSDAKEWLRQILFFAVFYVTIFYSLTYLKKDFAPGAIPWADAFASSTAFTAMWLMARKKVESWYWWIATNIASIPLYFVKHYVFTSVYYLVLLIMAFWGLYEWIKRANRYHHKKRRNTRMETIKKFVVIGPESTGKSTLCSQLAAFYKTNWVPEYAREYS